MKLLRLVAERTGGRLIRADWTDQLDVAFRAVLEEFRQRYLIGFTPEGVAKGDGWHTLQVKLARGRKDKCMHARAIGRNRPCPLLSEQAGQALP